MTLHNDCIFNGGPQGTDGGTFPGVDEPDRQQWIDYTMQVGGGNSYGGEGCDQAGDSAYNWTDWTDLCGDNGLVPYINQFQIAYMNVSNFAVFVCSFARGCEFRWGRMLTSENSLAIQRRCRSCSMMIIGAIVSILFRLRFSSIFDRMIGGSRTLLGWRQPVFSTLFYHMHIVHERRPVVLHSIWEVIYVY